MTVLRARGTLLTCEHTYWAKILPHPGDLVYCEKCGDYSPVPDFSEDKGTYYPDGEWYAFRYGYRKVRGVCARGDDGKGCGHTELGELVTVRNKMEKHYRMGCEHANIVFVSKPLPPNSPPPF